MTQEEKNIKRIRKQVNGSVRLALTGSANGLPVADIINTIGVDEAMRRIIYAIEKIGEPQGRYKIDD